MDVPVVDRAVEELPVRLPLGTRLAVGTPAQLAAARTRSHLPDGRCVGLLGPRALLAGWVVDAELDLAPPVSLARRFGTAEFWERWTRAECAAKLADVPMQRWLGRHGLDDPTPLGVRLETVRTQRGTLVLSTGRARHDLFTFLP
ncbi:MAG: hypothetical protein JWR42_359 [Marmoricola sp.]|nr:hypothetical protein [Marmoricola sp.]